MITYAQERLAAAMSDMQAMLPAQYAHTGDQTLPLDPNWQVYSALESRDAAVLFVARHDDRAVGYVAALLHPHMNSRQVLVGTISTYYAEEGPNRVLVVRRLLQQAAEWLAKRGAQRVYAETEYQHSAGRLLEALGFAPVKIGYMLTTVGRAGGSVQ